ncbi:hypothetical protein N665_1046s0016 [Sinapis alba]|nr:hypothetical protein N665_1046s0016 [Sinapis alba]
MGKSKNRPQVFINFRGKDERQKLLPHLKHHLKGSNVNVFTDDDAVGEPLVNLFKHIRRSRIVIVIFSINYLESEWCLDELVEIMKCLETEKLDFAIPIFYKVKTSHVKKQSGEFGKRFVDLQKKHRNSRVNTWKKALRFVATYIGLTYQKGSSISELDFIKMIVERVDLTLTKIASKDNNNKTEIYMGESSNLTDVHHLNKMLHSLTTLETGNLDRSYLQGFMFGSAWKDVINSLTQSSNNSFRTSQPANPLQFRGYNWGVDPLVEAPTCYRLLEPKVPQDYTQSITYHNNINQNHSLFYETGLDEYPTVPHQPYEDYFLPSYCEDAESEDKASSNIISSDFKQCPTVDPTSMHDDIVSTSHAPEPEDITRFISSDLNQYPTIDPTSMNDDIVSASHDAERQDKTSCISFLSSCFQMLFLSYVGEQKQMTRTSKREPPVATCKKLLS